MIMLDFNEGELAFIRALQARLQFKQLEQAVIFQAEVIDLLLNLRAQCKRFYAGIPGNPDSYEEICFEFEPEKS